MNVLVLAFVGLMPLTAPHPEVQAGPTIRASLAQIDFSDAALMAKPAKSVQAPAKAARSTRRKIVGGVLGAVGGFFAGAGAGALITPRNHPIPTYAIVGAPIGAIVGAVLGIKYF